MSQAGKSKTLRGRYRIKQDLFVACYLEVIEANDREFRTYLSLQRRRDTVVPVGTRLLLNADSLSRSGTMVTGERYDSLYVTVTGVEFIDEKALHICTPVERATHTEARKATRQKTAFAVMVPGGDEQPVSGEFVARNGSLSNSAEGLSGGLRLCFESGKAMLSLNLGQERTFEVTYRDERYAFTGRICHIQYDWKKHAHEVGIAFVALGDETEFILNKLIDPAFSVALAQNTAIDSEAGKISARNGL